MINLRDAGAELWEGWNRPKRVAFAILAILAAMLLPYAGRYSLTNFLNTPISSYQAVLVYPVGMYILMALGLNIVVGKSGLLDLGYVAFFAIGAYTFALLTAPGSAQLVVELLDCARTGYCCGRDFRALDRPADPESAW